MSFDDLFAEPIKKEEKEKPIKEKCSFCGKSYVNVNKHLKNCPENPDNVARPRSAPIRSSKSRRSADEGKLIEELREQFQKTLNPRQKEDLLLTVEEQEKFERVFQFLGGTEGYQFIYKTITGDKIRGSMPYIIDQCIEILKKHRIYILHHKTKWPISKKLDK